MKKTLVAISAALALASAGAVAQDVAGGSDAKVSTIGGVATGTIVAGAVAAGVLAAIVSNSSGVNLPGGPVEEECEPGETLVGGVCVPNGTTTTVTSTVTGTATVTVTTTGL